MLKALEQLNLCDLTLITQSLANEYGLAEHDDERALLRITYDKIREAVIEQEAWLIAEFSRD